MMRLRPTLLLRQLIRAMLAIVMPRRRFLVRGSRRESSVCLTFDDGPHPHHTPRLLDLFKNEGIVATFFLVGREAEKYPEIVERMQAEGHVVGNHSYSHQSRMTLSAQQAADEVRKGSEVLRKILGNTPTLYRPPQGKVTFRDLWWMWGERLSVVFWNADPKDYEKKSKEEVLAWFQHWAFRGGDLVLLHDTHPHTAEALPEIILRIRERGLKFATIKEWVG
jgi:peptidoglycan/xylan/chitin deacetylase (PgdA/CDA1 family)